ncbi:hypothetical protein DFJ73DRAFT_809693 [Zopfochytrium polystomum]|nr:hypothetical protein DFJ73DRAFT_809693 [Zopfochytrium polystomum]
MSFQGLTSGGGADCGPGPNQLSRLAKQLQEGDGFLQDRFGSHDPESLIAGPSQRPARMGLAGDQQLVDEFFNTQQSMGGGSASMARADKFAFREMYGELEGMLERSGPPQMGDWAGEFQQFQPAPDFRPENAEFEAAFAASRNAEFEHAYDQAVLGANANVSHQDWSAEFSAQAGVVEPALAGHHQLDEAFEKEWSEQFNTVTQSLDVKGKGKIEEIPSSQAEVDKLLNSWKEEFEKTGDVSGAAFDSKEWTDRFTELWGGMSGGENGEWANQFEDFSQIDRSLIDPDPVTGTLAEYRFESDNPNLSHPDPLAEGLRLLNEGGSLSQAAMAFEAAVQRNPDDSTAWMYLGQVQAENEKEGPAIAALQRSVQVNPDNLQALMSLAISYTNEGQELHAHASLQRWLRTKYPSIAEAYPSAENTTFMSPFEMHEQATQQFIAAVKAGPASAITREGTTPEGLDADLQVGLGVLFYMKNEYDKAIDCFHTALTLRPTDYLLWNRLGATLANSGKSEEAIDAYYKALELKPTFVRCRYNLGVSCINIGCYKEAAEHLLGALSMHVVAPNGSGSGTAPANVSENLWETLRRTFLHMDRKDLADLTYQDRDLDRFRKDFEF